jgi:putative hydroxymethylpyrimidine transport system permease protein
MTGGMTAALRLGGTVAVLLAGWQLLVSLSELPPYLLPGPLLVAETLGTRWSLIWAHAQVTLLEILLGFLIGTSIGVASGLVVAQVPLMRRWLLPVLILVQAIPVFALAPLLVLWFGYGLASKVAMASLIIYFPVTSAFFDGLRRTDPGWIDLARTMQATPLGILFRLRLPAALPALGSGLRMAAVAAPIGAVIGEWVGSSAGLGYLMLHANGRMQIDLVFAALVTLMAMTIALYFATDWAVRRAVPWAPEAPMSS